MYPGEIAKSTPDKPAIIMSDTGESMSFLELHEYAERMANLFQALVKTGDHVALCLENRMEFYPSLGRPLCRLVLHSDKLSTYGT